MSHEVFLAANRTSENIFHFPFAIDCTCGDEISNKKGGQGGQIIQRAM
jgi:hypothetical protein